VKDSRQTPKAGKGSTTGAVALHCHVQLS
jgi:hypothetical protein